LHVNHSIYGLNRAIGVSEVDMHIMHRTKTDWVGVPGISEQFQAGNRLRSAHSPTRCDTVGSAQTAKNHELGECLGSPGTGICHVSWDYPYLRSQVTIEGVLQEMGHLQNLRGSNQRRGRCPFHSSSNPKSRSFSVNLEKQHVFRCVHPECGHQGNALDLWAAYKQLDLHPAAIDLAKTFSLKITDQQRRGTRNNELAKHSKSENQKIRFPALSHQTSVDFHRYI